MRSVAAQSAFLRSARTLAAAACLAFSGALALPTTAEAQTCTLNPGDLWCGVVTVGALRGQLVAYGFSDPIGQGDLSDKMFSVVTNGVTTPYTIDSVSTGIGVGIGALSFSLTSDLTAADKEKLVLHVDGSGSFAFSDSTGPSAVQTYRWSSTGLDWMSATSVTLRLREAATSCTLNPGDGTVKLSGILGFWRRKRSAVECRINNLGSGRGAD